MGHCLFSDSLCSACRTWRNHESWIFIWIFRLKTSHTMGFVWLSKPSRHKMQSCCAGKASESTVSCSHWHCDSTSCLSWWYAVWCRIPVYYPYGNLICRKQKSANGIKWVVSIFGGRQTTEQVPEQLVRRWSLWCDPKISYISTVYLWVIVICKADLATVAKWADVFMSFWHIMEI